VVQAYNPTPLVCPARLNKWSLVSCKFRHPYNSPWLVPPG